MLNRQNPSDKDLLQTVRAADRTGFVVTEQVTSTIQAAEAKAEEIRRDAGREAHEIRKEASDAANRVIEAIDAIERPLGELVTGFRHETDRLRNEPAGAPGPVDVPSEAIEPRSTNNQGAEGAPATSPPEALRAFGEPPSAPSEAPAVAAGGSASPLEEADEVTAESRRRSRQKGKRRPRRNNRRKAEPSEIAVEEPIEGSATKAPELKTEDQLPTDAVDTDREDDTEEPAAGAAEAGDEERQERGVERRKAKLLGRTEGDGSSARGEGSTGVSSWKGVLATKRDRLFDRFGGSRETPFITSEGQCAVCHRTLQVESEEAVAESDWLVNGDVGLCPDCQSQGWQLPEGARLPFRRGGA